MFSQKDIEQISKKGINLQEVEQQLEKFRNGFPGMKAVKPATTNDGIRKFSEEQTAFFLEIYEKKRQDKRMIKFVPASGAASRMFKDLFSFYGKNNPSEPVSKDVVEGNAFVNKFFSHLKEFAFYNDLKKVLVRDNMDIEQLLANNRYSLVLEYFLTPKGLNYGNLPKGLLRFHKYGDVERTALEEHLLEGINYARNADNSVEIHFTVSTEHKELFLKHVAEVKDSYEKKYNVRFVISYSEQLPSTDTIAVDMNNNPFREEDGTLLFRPGGHGALLHNINQIDRDCVFIKNIDNVTVDKHEASTTRNKKLLAGVLFDALGKIYAFIEELKKAENINDARINEMHGYLAKELCVLNDEFNGYSREQKIAYLIKKFNRPVRVCGMVKSEGDTGGGPFWAVNPDSTVSLQIVETSQLDLGNPEIKKVFDSSTHFNPNDIALCHRDYLGKKFDLFPFRDPQTGFITKKSKDGKDLKALELPGLWNGSMSDWNTIFVEVPMITFNPVKAVNDLLEEEHRG